MKKRYALAMALSLAATSALADDAAELWGTKCKSCHGPDGKAQTPMGKKESIVDMSQPAWQKAQKDSDLREVIADGSPRNKKMKPFKEKLTAEQIDALVKYVRTFKQK